MIIKSKFYDIARAYEKEHPKLRIAFWRDREKFILIVSMFERSHQGTSIFKQVARSVFEYEVMNKTLFVLAIGDIINRLKRMGIYVEEA